MCSLFTDLRARYLEGRLIVFAGAGISLSGGLPSWTGLIQHILAEARSAASASDLLALGEADTALARRDLVRALGILQATMTSAAYNRVVSRALDDSQHAVPPLACAIAGLAPTLHAVVTTNLDRFLARAFAGEWPSFTLPGLDLGQQRHYILQLHGTRTNRSSWVLSERDYEDLLHGRPELQRYLEGLFRFHPLLFVGYGLRDPDFDHLCRQLRVFGRGQAPQHFALMPEGQAGQYERRLLAEAGIELLVYANLDGTHSELPRILNDLAASQPRLSANVPHLATTPTGASNSGQTTNASLRCGALTPTARGTADPPTPSTLTSQPAANRLEALCDLLQSCFSEHELRRFVTFLPGASGLPARLPGQNVSLSQLVLEAVLVLERDGMLTAEFFTRLRNERPGRAAAVTAVQALFIPH